MRKCVSLFAGIGGFDYAMERAGCEVMAQVEKEPFCLAVLETHWPKAKRFTDVKEFGASRLGFPAKTFPSPEGEQDSPENALDSFMSLRASCESFDPLGLSSRMYPDFSVQTTDETLQKCSAFSWSNAGMGFRGVCSTASFSESPKDAVACSLSEVLENHAPQRFFLSARAAAGILRRAAKRGRMLPSRLQRALEALATGTETDGTQPTSQLRSPAEAELQATHQDEGERMTKTSSSSKPSPRNGRKAQAAQRETSTTISSSQIPSEKPTGITGEAARAETDATICSPCVISENTEEAYPRSENQAETAAEEAKELSSSKMFADTETNGRTESGSTNQVGQCTRSTEPASTPSHSLKISVENCEQVQSAHNSVPEEESQEADTQRRSVRRLTPTECETLQGFPKGWTVPATELWGTRSRRKSSSGLCEE